MYDNVSGAFSAVSAPKNHAAKDAIADMKRAITHFKECIEQGDNIEDDPLSITDNLQKISDLGVQFKEAATHYYIASLKQVLKKLSFLPDAPTIGQDFITSFEKTGCRYVVDKTNKDAARANYSAYHPVSGYTNTVTFNPHEFDMNNFPEFFNAAIHEYTHPQQYGAADAMHFIPWNPKTFVLVHPMDKARLDNVCERVAYSTQALMNFLVVRAHPEDRDLREAVLKTTGADVLSLEDMEGIIAENPDASLQDIMTRAALQSLDKSYTVNEPGYTFNDSYFRTSINDYREGLKIRNKVGTAQEKNPGVRFVYVRLDDADFHAAGNHGVGPNPLGADTIDQRFLRPPSLLPEEQENYDDLCAEFDIPAPEDCMTLSEYMQSQMPIPQPVEKSNPTPAFVQTLPFSNTQQNQPAYV